MGMAGQIKEYVNAITIDLPRGLPGTQPGQSTPSISQSPYLPGRIILPGRQGIAYGLEAVPAATGQQLNKEQHIHVIAKIR